MKFAPPLIEATLLNRYKRFLSDIELDGLILNAHVPNTGSMESCWAPGWKCAVSRSLNPNRKLPYTLELTYNGVTWIGVNTANANKLALEWLTCGLLPELSDYQLIIPEKKIGNSRVDFYLEGHPTKPACYVEIKNVTLLMDGKVQFPDAVTERGQKHLKELMEIKKSGLRSAMLFIVQREDAEMFIPAQSIDPTYAALLKEAYEAGVEILVYGCKMSLTEITLKGPMNWELPW